MTTEREIEAALNLIEGMIEGLDDADTLPEGMSEDFGDVYAGYWGEKSRCFPVDLEKHREAIERFCADYGYASPLPPRRGGGGGTP